MTVDQIFAPSNSGQTYSIQDVLSAVGGQYQSSQMAAPQRSQSIDEVLSNLSGRMPQAAAPFKVGAGQYIPNIELMASNPYKPSEPYKPGEFTRDALFQNNYAAAIAAGKSEAAARQEAAKIDAKWGQAGAMAGSYFFGPIGGYVGGQIGKELAPVLDDLTSGIGDIFGW